MALVKASQIRHITPAHYSSDVASDCAYIQAIATGGENEDVDSLIRRLGPAILRIRSEADQCPLKADQCQEVAKKLNERKVKQVWLVLGYVFFILIIPAILAYQASQNNAKLQLQMQQLADLSAILRVHQPRKTLEELRIKLDSLNHKVDLLLKSPVPSSEIEHCKHETRISKLDQEALGVQAQIKKLISDHEELKRYVPEEAMPEMPMELLGEVAKEAESVTSQLQTATTSARVAAGIDSEQAAERARNTGISAAADHIAALAVTGSPGAGIRNGGNSCYAASVIQSMRWNPVTRYLVDRELPHLEFSFMHDETTGMPIFKKDTPEMARYRRNVQRALKVIFQKLDSGETITPEHINSFRELVASGDSQTPSPWNQKGRRGHYIQQDAQEFQQYLEDVLLKSTISNPSAVDECHLSGLQEVVSRDLYIIPDPSLLHPAPASADAVERVRYRISENREYASMHALEVPFLSLDEGICVNPFDCTPRFIEASFGVVTEPIEECKFSLSEKGPGIEQIRARVKERVIDPCQVHEPLVEVTDGQFYRVGKCERTVTRLNNPPSLTIQIKRFAFTELGQVRISGPVPVPSTLGIKDADAAEGLADVKYDITSCVCHLGSTPNGGHYISYAKVGDTWYEFNDGAVREAKDFDPSTHENLYTVQYSRRA